MDSCFSAMPVSSRISLTAAIASVSPSSNSTARNLPRDSEGRIGRVSYLEQQNSTAGVEQDNSNHAATQNMLFSQRKASFMRPILLNLGEPDDLITIPWAGRVSLVDSKYSVAWELSVVGTVDAPAVVLLLPGGYVATVGDHSPLGSSAVRHTVPVRRAKTPSSLSLSENTIVDGSRAATSSTPAPAEVTRVSRRTGVNSPSLGIRKTESDPFHRPTAKVSD